MKRLLSVEGQPKRVVLEAVTTDLAHFIENATFAAGGTQFAPSETGIAFGYAIDLPRVAGTEADPASAQADSCYRPKKKLRFDKELVRVAFKPWRPGLPVRQGSVSITDRHLDLRQTLGVEHFVLRDDAVYIEQKRRQRVYLIGGQRSFSIEGHGAIDVIPDRRRERRSKRQYSFPCPDVDIRASGASFAFQNGRFALDTRRPMAYRALRAIDLRALLRSSAPWREFLSGRADRDIPRAELLCGRRASHTVSARLRLIFQG